MEPWSTVQRLRGVLLFLSDSAVIYRKALDGVTALAAQDLLAAFAREHTEHITELEAALTRAGSQPLPDSPKPRIVREALAALDRAAAVSDDGCLVVCLQWEEHAVHAYESALGNTIPRPSRRSSIGSGPWSAPTWPRCAPAWAGRDAR